MGCRRRGSALVPGLPAAAPQDAIGHAAEAVGFPCVVKAVSLSASQGILRADDPAAAVTAARRIRQVLAAAGRTAGEPVLVEEYLPGPELSIDGLLTGGDLTVTAIFDKPATPDGPTFEETLLVTPVPCQNSFIAADLAFRTRYAALRYSLIRPPRTCLCSILEVMSRTWPGWRKGGSCCRLWCGRWPL